MFLGYVVGWLRTEENTFLTVPLNKTRAMPTRYYRSFRYKAHGSMALSTLVTQWPLFGASANSVSPPTALRITVWGC